MGGNSSSVLVTFWLNEYILKSVVVVVAQSVNIQKLELYTLNGRMVWDVNYISIELLEILKRLEAGSPIGGER